MAGGFLLLPWKSVQKGRELHDEISGGSDAISIRLAQVRSFLEQADMYR